MLKTQLAFLKDVMRLSTTSMAFYNYLKARLLLSTKQGLLVFFFFFMFKWDVFLVLSWIKLDVGLCDLN